jgi:hypothetical protein
MPSSTTADTTSVAASATSVALFTASTNQVSGRSVFNDSTAELKVKFGTAASATSFKVAIPPGGYFEFPLSQGNVYAGVVHGIWSTATGSARCSEES